MENKLEKIRQNIKATWTNEKSDLCSDNEWLQRSDQLCRDAEWLLAEVERLHKILHDLTLGSSEFYQDADRCAENIREQIDISRRIAKQTIRNSRIG